jgi:hypothetical protein
MVSSGFLQEPHGVTTQKTPFLIETVVCIIYLTRCFVRVNEASFSVGRYTKIRRVAGGIIRDIKPVGAGLESTAYCRDPSSSLATKYC